MLIKSHIDFDFLLKFVRIADDIDLGLLSRGMFSGNQMNMVAYDENQNLFEGYQLFHLCIDACR